MEQEDFERLETLCEKEGFRIGSAILNGFAVYSVEKDIWDGVEFIESIASGPIGLIFKIESIYENNFNYRLRGEGKEGNSHSFAKKAFKPSTEQAYVEQITKEAFLKFGEIVPTESFNHKDIGFMTIWPNGFGYSYDKDSDEFKFNDSVIYQKGKWSRRTPKRVEVLFRYHAVCQKNQPGENIDFNFKLSSKPNKINFEIVGEYLRSKLEKYLNN